MEKRRLTSLRSVLLQYLVRTALACLLVAVGWLLGLLLWIQNDGPFLPANQAAQACQKAAQDVLPGMTAATFDETQLDSLCRYALFAAPDSSEVLATNMDAGHLQRAMENWQGKTRWHFGYTQYYMTSKLQDGTVCLLQVPGIHVGGQHLAAVRRGKQGVPAQGVQLRLVKGGGGHAR